MCLMNQTDYEKHDKDLKALEKRIALAAKRMTPTLITRMADHVAMGWLEPVSGIADPLEYKLAVKYQRILSKMWHEHPHLALSVKGVLEADQGEILTPEYKDQVIWSFKALDPQTW